MGDRTELRVFYAEERAAAAFSDMKPCPEAVHLDGNHKQSDWTSQSDWKSQQSQSALSSIFSIKTQVQSKVQAEVRNLLFTLLILSLNLMLE